MVQLTFPGTVLNALLTSHNNLMKYVLLLLSPFYIWGNGGTERLISLPKVMTYLLSGRTRVQSRHSTSRGQTLNPSATLASQEVLGSHDGWSFVRRAGNSSQST